MPIIKIMSTDVIAVEPETETDALDTIAGWLRDEQGITVVLIEHDMRVVMNISERISEIGRAHV